jgi:hypothetical protein
LVINNYKGTETLTTTFNFNENDSAYIRKVFNTNPARTNSGVDSAPLKYFLGETFDRHMKANITNDQTFAAIVKLYNQNAVSGSDHKADLQSAQTPSIISCDLGAGAQNLFTIHALEQPGDWTNRNIKVSIEDVKRSTNESTDYGTFSVVLRALSDSDNVVRVIEQFNNCNLNPDSTNYIARRIGDSYQEWEASDRRYMQKGNYPAVSQFVRVAMNSEVDAGLSNPALLPFGFRGIFKYADEDLKPSDTSGNWVTGSVTVGSAVGGVFKASGSAPSCSVAYPAPELRVSASDGDLSNPTDAYFGFQTAKSAGSTVFDRSTIDLLRPR